MIGSVHELPGKAQEAFLSLYGMQTGTVSVLLHRIRKKLKKHLEKEGFF